MDRVTNQEVLKRAGTGRRLLNIIRKRQSVFFGHVMRREGMELVVTAGKIQGKRSRGRQREKMIDGLAAWLDEKTATLTRVAQNRERWRSKTANAFRHGT